MEAWKMVVTDQLDGRSGHRRLLAWLTCNGKRPDQSSPQYGAVDHADLFHLSGFWFPVARHHTELVGDGCLYPRTSHDAYGWRGLVTSTPAYIHLQTCPKYEHIKTSLCALQALTLAYVLVNIKNKGVIASTLAVHVRIYTRKSVLS